MPFPRLIIRALHLGESIDIKGLEREDAFSKTPLGFRTNSGGMAVLFKTGAVAFVNMTPIEEDEQVRGLGHRIKAPLEPPEVETAVIEEVPVIVLATFRNRRCTPFEKTRASRCSAL